MKSYIKKSAYPLFFFAGGGLYCLLELAWRGRTHHTMALLGGACSCMLYRLSGCKRGLCRLALLGGIFITLSELFSGLLINRMLGMGVWDYSRHRYNILGQICPLYTFFWCMISLPALAFMRFFRRKTE